MEAEFPVMLSAGEALTDMIACGHGQWRSVVGGSTWNVARSMAKLGLATGFAGAVSKDLFGQELLRASADAGLDLRLLQQYERPPLLAIVGESTPPDYFFIGSDSADLHFDPAQLPTVWSSRLQWAHFGGISLARQPLAGKLLGLARQLKAQGVKISYDPNFRNNMHADYDATLHEMGRLADLIKVSDDDLRGLFRCPDADLAFKQLRAINPAATVLYTRGELGASLHIDTSVWRADALKVAVADTIGAGDASIAGLLYSLFMHPERAPENHLRFALAAGAAACMASGAQAPGLQQIEALYKGPYKKN